MTDKLSLISLDGLSKPANTLIKKVSSAVGVVFEPTRIKRKAKAEAEAAKIKALASIEIKEIEQRAINRFIYQESRKQENIEQITFQAASSLNEEAKNVENIEEDWIAHFFKNCDTVSDKEMQSLWARILSGEASNPGTFSKRTVNFIASIDKKDAELFTEFCQFVCTFNRPTPLIFNEQDNIHNEKGINFNSLKHLNSIGLISFESLGYQRLNLKKYAQIFYFDMPILIEFNKEKENVFKAGKVIFTEIGHELFTVCGANKNERFYEYIIDKLHEQGLILSTPIN